MTIPQKWVNVLLRDSNLCTLALARSKLYDAMGQTRVQRDLDHAYESADRVRNQSGYIRRPPQINPCDKAKRWTDCPRAWLSAYLGFDRNFTTRALYYG